MFLLVLSETNIIVSAPPVKAVLAFSRNLLKHNNMIGNQNNKTTEGYVNVTTKVPPNVSDLLNILAAMRGMEVYELLQLLIHGFISYAKAEQSVPDEFRHLYESLKFDVAWNSAYNFCSPSARQDIAQLILILQQRGRKGFGMAMIDKPFMSEATMTRSVPAIYERVSEVSLGTNDYIRLRRMNISRGTKSELETVRTMLDAQEIINIEESDREEMPAMGDRTEGGRIAGDAAFGHRMKTNKRRTPDGEAQRQLHIIFTDEDRQAAEHEAKEGDVTFTDEDSEDASSEPDAADVMEKELGFRPHGMDW